MKALIIAIYLAGLAVMLWQFVTRMSGYYFSFHSEDAIVLLVAAGVGVMLMSWVDKRPG